MHFQICGNNDGNIIHVFKNCISISVATVLEVSKMTVPICTFTFTFTFMHLADAFIQSDLHCIQVTILHFISSCFPWDNVQVIGVW